jgi:lysophospholipase L1-like esterase
VFEIIMENWLVSPLRIALRFGKVRAMRPTRAKIINLSLMVSMCAAAIAEPTARVKRISSSDANLFTTPENWLGGGGELKTSSPGAYLKLGFTGATFGLVLDTSNYADGQPGHDLPKIGFQIDGGEIGYQTVTRAASSITLELARGLPIGSHQIRISLEGLGHENRWNNPVDQLRIRGFEIDSDGDTARPDLESKRMVVYGDSITEGANTLDRVNVVATKQWSTSWDAVLANLLGAETSTIAYQAQGYSNPGQGQVPPFPQAWVSVEDGVRRKFSHPDYVFVNQGTNGGADSSSVAAMMENFRTVYPSAKLYFVVPFNGSARDGISVAYNQMHKKDAKLFVLDLGYSGQQLVQENSTDGTHPTPTGDAELASALYRQVASGRSYASASYGSSYGPDYGSTETPKSVWNIFRRKKATGP